MNKTRAGLPNSCHDCGTPLTEYWYAMNDDVAKSGGGRCGVCSGMEPVEVAAEPEPAVEAAKPARRRKAS